MTQRTPIVGAVVHYYPGDAQHRSPAPHPAIITRVLDATRVNLRVFFDMERATGIRDQAMLLDGSSNKPGWRWPPG